MKQVFTIFFILAMMPVFFACQKVEQELDSIRGKFGIYSAPQSGRPGERKDFVGNFGPLDSDLHIYFGDFEAEIVSRRAERVPPGGIVYGGVDSVDVQRVKIVVPEGLQKGAVAVRVSVAGVAVPAPDFNVTELPPLVPGNVWVSTYAGKDSPDPGLHDGLLLEATFGRPNAMVVTPDSIIYVADYDYQTNQSYIRKVADGRVTTIAGGGDRMEGAGNTVRFGTLNGMATDADGLLYVADINMDESGNYFFNRICRIDPATHEVQTFAGAIDSMGISSSGYFVDGPLRKAILGEMRDLTFDHAGQLYFSEYLSNTVRKISGGQVTTPFGLHDCFEYLGENFCTNIPGFEDGFGTEVKITNPLCIATALNGKLYFTEEASTIREYNAATNEVSTIAGMPYQTLQNYGPLKASRFYQLRSVVPDGQGNLLAIDYGYILKIDLQAETVAILAGSPSPGFRDGPGTEAAFNLPSDLGYDAHGNLYVLDRSNRVIRKVTVQP